MEEPWVQTFSNIFLKLLQEILNMSTPFQSKLDSSVTQTTKTRFLCNISLEQHLCTSQEGGKEVRLLTGICPAHTQDLW